MDAAEHTDLHAVDPVPCAGCNACCRGHQIVVVSADMGDRMTDYPVEGLVKKFYGEVGHMVLRTQDNGDCFFLRDSKCTIYATRPNGCRRFDCRRRMALGDEGTLSKEIMAAGTARLNTLKPQAWEKSLIEAVNEHSHEGFDL